MTEEDDVNPAFSWHLRAARYVLVASIALVLVATLSTREIPAALDDENYLAYLSQSQEILAIKLEASSLSELLSAEPIWLLLNSLLANVFAPELALRVLIALSALVAVVSVARMVNWNWLPLLCFFLHPQVLMSFVTHLRQGVAISIFLAFLAFRPKWIAAASGISALVHSSFFPITLLLIASRMDAARARLASRPFWRTMLVWLILAAITPPILQDVLGWLGDRRVDDYGHGIAAGASGLGVVLWAGILIILVRGRTSTSDESWRMAVAIVSLYLAWYFFIEVGSRMLGSAFIYVWLAGIALTPNYRRLFWALWIASGIYIGIDRVGQTALYGF